MRKTLKGTWNGMAVMLAFMLVFSAGMSSAWAANCGDTDFDGVTDTTCSCGDVVVGGSGGVQGAGPYTYTLTADLTCSTRHGLIVGNEYITIDGAGFKIDGSGLAMSSRNCEVMVAPEEEPDRMWCVGHPCRQSADGNVLDSGIVNANTTLGNSCNPAAGMGQGGCDNVTIKNLEIVNFCDGIWVSGDCSTGAGHTRGAEYGSDAEYRLTGLLIEGNEIHDCGGGDCGTYTESAEGDGGDWTYRYYNDGIFTAQIGVDSTNSDEWAAFDGLPVQTGSEFWSNRFQWWKVLCTDCEGDCTNPLCDCYFSLHKMAALNRIIHNKIYDIDACGCVSCSGGMGITLQGGLEIEPVNWAGGNVISHNLLKNCGMSGISYSHATMHNRIHNNYAVDNQYGGITNGCGWCDENYIFDNYLADNYGMGIGVFSKATIANNVVVETHALPAGSQLAGLTWAVNGENILVLAETTDSEVVGNIACLGEGLDIEAPNSVGEENRCTDSNFTPGCQYDCYSDSVFFSLCRADANMDCKVNSADLGYYFLERGSGQPTCCPDKP